MNCTSESWANSYDDAATESFFGHRKEEVVHQDRFDSIEQFEQEAIVPGAFRTPSKTRTVRIELHMRQ